MSTETEYTFLYTGEESTIKADTGGFLQKIAKGGYYKGKITNAGFEKNGQSVSFVIEIETTCGQTTGKIFTIITTKAGLTVDKNGNELSGRNQLSALIALCRITKITTGKELIGLDIAFLGKIVNSYDGKYRNVSVLNWMKADTNQTFTEIVKKIPAARYLSPVKDDEEIPQEPQTADDNQDNDAENNLPYQPVITVG